MYVYIGAQFKVEAVEWTVKERYGLSTAADKSVRTQCARQQEESVCAPFYFAHAAVFHVVAHEASGRECLSLV